MMDKKTSGGQKTASPTRRRRVWWIIGIVCTILAIGLGGASWYMLDYALCPDRPTSYDLPRQLARTVQENPQIKPWIDSLQQHHALRDTFVTMPTGERHHAVYVRAPHARGRVAVLVHGYTDNCMSMIHIASVYGRLGYHLLLPDLHGHGRSEGKAIQMGWKDRLDVLHWTQVAQQMFADPEAKTQMVLHGVSMGAATVMSLSGEKLPAYIKCLVEDCGYTSVWDEFSNELAQSFHLPAFPLMYTTSLLCQWRYGWRFGEASPLRQVAKCRLPMLFIHGDKDTYVPFAMLQPLYEAKPQPKEMWVVPGAVHATSFRDQPEAYTERVNRFVNQYID